MRYLFIILLLASCTPQQRLQRFIEKNPELLKPKIDTVYIESVVVDTLFKYNTVKDTVVIQKDKLTMKYFYNNTDSTVFLSGLCDKDTIYVPVQTVTVNDNQSWSSVLKSNVGFLGAILIGFIMVLLIALIKK